MLFCLRVLRLYIHHMMLHDPQFQLESGSLMRPHQPIAFLYLLVQVNRIHSLAGHINLAMRFYFG